MKYAISFQSKTDSNNTGYFFRNRKVGFTGVNNLTMARKFKTESEAIRVLTNLESREGEWYFFELNEVA